MSNDFLATETQISESAKKDAMDKFLILVSVTIQSSMEKMEARLRESIVAELKLHIEETIGNAVQNIVSELKTSPVFDFDEMVRELEEASNQAVTMTTEEMTEQLDTELMELAADNVIGIGFDSNDEDVGAKEKFDQRLREIFGKKK